jgi:hypothetical protein
MEVGQAHRKCHGKFHRFSLASYPNLACHSKVVNAGDGMESLSGGYYRATIHR